MITAHQLQYSVQLLYHHLADPLDDLLTHTVHLLVNLLLGIALLASPASIELVSSREAGTHRPDPRDTWVR